MGALTSLTKWIPEDDLLLKNAVEAGAPLESLAKGEVQFSRRYTMRELLDRWRSLLYDLDTSIQASARMVEIELDLAASNRPNATRACNPNPKGKESSCRKRKADSVRSHYHAMRKRIRSEPCAVNLNFFEPCALLAATECDKGSGEQLIPDNKHSAHNFGLKVPFADDYVHPETGYASAHHAFHELMRVDSFADDGNFSHQASHEGHVGSAEDGIPDGRSGEGCLIAYPENISSVPHDEAECNIGNQSFECNFQQRDFPNILGENLIDTSSEIHDIGQSNALGRSSLYKDEDIGVKCLSDFNSSNYNHEVGCADFVKNDNLSPHVPEYGDSFHHQSKYSSPPSGMHIWRNMEDKATPTMPINGQYGDKTHGLLNVNCNKNISAPGCDVVSSEPMLDDGMRGAGLNNPTMMQENDFIDFPDAYMDFDNDDSLLFMDVIEKDNTDGACLGLLLNSPGATHLAVASSSDHGPTNVSEACLEIPDAPCSGEPNVLCDQPHSQLPDDHNNHVSGVNVPYTSTQISNTVKLREEFMTCVLNTEDLEIPNNDHVIFPDTLFPSFSSNLEQSYREITRFVSAGNVMSTNGRDHVGVLNKVEEQVANVQPTVSPLKASSLSLPKVGVLHSSNGCAVGADPSMAGSIAGGSGYTGNGVDDTKPCRSEAVGLNSTPDAAFEEECTAPCFQDQDNPDDSFASFLESHLQETDDDKVHPLNATGSFSKDPNMEVGIEACLPTTLGSGEAGFFESVGMVSPYDQDDQFSDCDDDVPHFSDIEALILDMDLGPYDEESCVFSKEVSRYRHIDIKNTVRWEHGFLSHTSRSISSHGAFAVFYGRHLKYYIKDAEVSIGRETEDMRVDIDLGREGCANKISRRQAIIKMDEKGSFSLKNIGKFSIFVNGKEVPAKKFIKLEPHSLVKIRDMHFAFEVNQSAVRKYIKKVHRSSQEPSTFNFDCRPDRYP